MDRSADWLRQAELDLRAAEDLAATGHHEWAAFAAQQSAEKAVKALVESLHGSVRGHSITAILQQALDVREDIVTWISVFDHLLITS